MRLVSCLGLLAALAAGPAAAQPDRQPAGGGVTLALNVGTMRVSFCGEQIAHVEVSPTGAFSARPSLVVVSCQPPAEVSTEALVQNER